MWSDCQSVSCLQESSSSTSARLSETSTSEWQHCATSHDRGLLCSFLLPAPGVICHYSPSALSCLCHVPPSPNLMVAVEAVCCPQHLPVAAAAGLAEASHTKFSHLIQRASFLRLQSCHLITAPGELGGGREQTKRKDNSMTSVSSLTKWGCKQWKDICYSVNGC